MAQPVVTSTTQKIHTYAQDLEAVRSAKNQSTSTKTPTPAIPTPKIKTVHSSPLTTPSPSPAANALLIPAKVSAPAVRTMAQDKSLHKTVTADNEPKKQTDSPINNPTNAVPRLQMPLPKIATPPTTAPAPTPTTAHPTAIVTTEKSTPSSTKNSPPAKPPVTLVVGKKTRDSSYAATVITDSKHKRFSIWKELRKMLSNLTTRQPKKTPSTYTASVAPLQKGVVTKATTNNGRASIADYSTLKEKVRRRQESGSSHTESASEPRQAADYNQLSEPLNTELEKARSALLNSIEEEVSHSHGEPLPAFVTQVKPKVSPQAEVAVSISPTPSTVNATPLIKPSTIESGWEYFIETPHNEPLVVSTTLPHVELQPKNAAVTYRSSTYPTNQSFTVIENVASTTKEDSSHIPEIHAELNMELSPTDSVDTIQTAAETPEVVIETVAEEVTKSTPEVASETSVTPPPEPLFVQPKIVPHIPNFESPSIPSPSPTVSMPSPIIPTTNQTTPPSTPATRVTPETVTTPTTVPPQTPKRKRTYRLLSLITTRTHTFMFGGLVVASIVVVGTLVISSLMTQFATTPQTIATHQYFNSSALHSVMVRPLSALTITEAIMKHNNEIGVSELQLLSTDEVVVSPTIIISLMQLSLDPSFSASLSDIRFGWYRGEPFMVMRYAGDSIARGALLQWERTMYRDFLTIFGDTSITPAVGFKDTVVNGIDTRRFTTSTDNTVLIYGSITSGHTIITTTEMSFINLANNFNPK